MDLLAVQGTLKSLHRHHNLEASILWHSAFFMVQFSHPYMTTGKTIALTIQTFVGKLMFLLFNTLSRFVIAFLPRSCAAVCLVAQSCSTLCDPMDCSWLGSSIHGDSPGKNTGVGSLSLLQGIFPTQELNHGLLHCRWILYQLSY